MAPIRDLIWGRQSHGDPRAKSSSSLQIEAPPWTKPSGHPLHPILGALVASIAAL